MEKNSTFGLRPHGDHEKHINKACEEIHFVLNTKRTFSVQRINERKGNNLKGKNYFQVYAVGLTRKGSKNFIRPNFCTRSLMTASLVETTCGRVTGK